MKHLRMPALKSDRWGGRSWCEPDNHTEEGWLPHCRIRRLTSSFYQFAVEMQIGILISLMHDVMGLAFVPHHVAVTHRAGESRLPS